MLLVAITGPVGSEKSTTLAGFATYASVQGFSVDGFVSVAGARPILDRGAHSYTLYWVKSGDEDVFAKRNDEGAYELEPKTLEKLAAWSTGLTREDVVVLDEFGKWESEGGGLIEYWPAIRTSNPRMVVVTLRKGVQEAVEYYLGKKFDRVLDAEDSDTKEKLQRTLIELRDWELVGTFGASSGGIECSLGTWLHSLRFPLTGTVMAPIQAAMLALASKGLGHKAHVVWISTIAAGLKALSIDGRRISPMFAIAIQGFLFAIGAALGRWTKWGFAIGAFLVGIWAALQGIFIQYLMLGRDLDRAWGFGARYIGQKLGLQAPQIWVAILILCLINGVISLGLTLFILARYPKGLTKAIEKPPSTSKLNQVLFFVPLVLVSLTFFLAGENPAHTMWLLLRYSAVLACLYGLTKFVRQIDFAGILRRRGLWGPSHALEVAQDSISSPRE